MALQALAVLALGDVREHLVMHLVCGAVGDPEKQARSVTGLHGTSSHLDVQTLLGLTDSAA